ncbi:hypothetical protein WEI85_07280 [Actinomycetes bacterium KLBMP 9797]
MTTTSTRPADLEWRVFRGSEAVRDGLLTPHQLRSSAWLHVRHDTYADARMTRDHRLACQAFRLRLPPLTVFAGPSAAYLHGVAHAADFDDEVHVIVPPYIRVAHQHGLRPHALLLEAAERGETDGMATTTPLRTAWDSALWLELGAAVAIVDSLLALGRVTRDELTALADRRLGQPWTRRARRVFDLSDGRARSPAESHLRIGLITAGLPRPLVRYPVELPDGGVAHPALSWPRFRVAIELEEREACDIHLIGRERRGRLASAGWTVLQVASRRSQRDFASVVREIRPTLVSHGWR